MSNMNDAILGLTEITRTLAERQAKSLDWFDAVLKRLDKLEKRIDTLEKQSQKK